MKYVNICLLILLNFITAITAGTLIYRENQYKAPSRSQIKSFADTLVYSEKYIKERRLTDDEIRAGSVNVESLKLNGWLPNWALREGLKSIEENKQRLEMVSPVYYALDKNGQITVDYQGLEDLRKTIEGSSIKIVPTIASFEASNISQVLKDEVSLRQHYDKLVKEVEDQGFDGLDLDYEGIFLKDQENFYKLLEMLSTYFHGKNKILTIAVLSKWGDDIGYSFQPETRKVQDYARIAQYVDQIRIMTYDYTSPGGLAPGPVAPIEWMDSVLNYAVQKAPKEKIMVGVNLYGYIWAAGESSRAVDYRQIADIKEQIGNADFFYSDSHQEAAVRYVQNGKTHFGYFADPRSILARINLAAKYGVRGVSFWRLGDDPL